jgi:hypothetical protein
MLTKKADRRLLSVPRWGIAAVILSGAAVACAQFGGGAGAPADNPADAPAAEQRLFPNGLPKIDAMLKAALEHHPDVFAARSKLRSAEAELRQAELKAMREIMDARGRWEEANRAVAQSAAVKGGADHPRMREPLAKLAAIEWELAFLLGTRGELRAEGKATAEAGPATPNAADSGRIYIGPVQIETLIPRQAQAMSIREKLDKEISVKVKEKPLAELIAALSEQSGLRFVLNRQALEEEGLPADTPVTLDLGKMELGTAIQALEDLQKPLYFVVRDYGVLVTTESHRSYETVSVLDFWKLNDKELSEKIQQQRREETGGMMGGGMGGGGAF